MIVPEVPDLLTGSRIIYISPGINESYPRDSQIHNIPYYTIKSYYRRSFLVRIHPALVAGIR